jgi:hypothetical protein
MNVVFHKNSSLFPMHPLMFSGVGSRETPEIFKFFMASISYILGCKGYGLRSGRAKGSDHFFEIGVPNHMAAKAEIYLPRANFGQRTHCRSVEVTDSKALMEAMWIIDKNRIHENWQNLINQKGGEFSVSAHTRNVFQGLGLVPHVTNPSKFLICWTTCGSKTFEETSEITGGTRTAIRLASIYGIPVFNLAKHEDCIRLYKMVTDFASKYRIPFLLPKLEDLLKFSKP